MRWVEIAAAIMTRCLLLIRAIAVDRLLRYAGAAGVIVASPGRWLLCCAIERLLEYMPKQEGVMRG